MISQKKFESNELRVASDDESAGAYGTQSEFEHLMQRVRDGSQDAAWQLLQNYGPHVRRVVRRTLRPEMRSRFDSIDFAQAVWASFFAQVKKFSEANDPRQLIAMLVAIAKHKVIDEMRRQMDASKRNISRECRLDEYDESLVHPVRRQPTPSEFAIARERWSHMLADKPARDQEILRLRFNGETQRSIAEMLNVSERTVQRVLEKCLNG